MKPLLVCATVFVLSASTSMLGQLIDKNKAPNTANEGITRPLMGSPYPSQIGDGRWGDDPNASQNVIAYDPFRAIRRGRQLFQRKFTRFEGLGAVPGDGFGNIERRAHHRRRCSPTAARHATGGLAARRASAATWRPVPTAATRRISSASASRRCSPTRSPVTSARFVPRRCRQARRIGSPVTRTSVEQGHQLRHDPGAADGTVDTSARGRRRCRPARSSVLPPRRHDLDPRVRRRRAQSRDGARHGRRSRISTAAQSGPVTTAGGMVLNGLTDTIEHRPRPTRATSGPSSSATALVDFLEFYLLNYFKAGTGEQTPRRQERSRGVRARSAAQAAMFRTSASSATGAWPTWRRCSTRTTATSTASSPRPRLLLANPSSIGQAGIREESRRPQPFLVKNIFTDFKRHDLGPSFHERNYDGTMRTRVPDDAAVGCGQHGRRTATMAAASI